ncbi:MAG: DUF3987 domain-containing protein [Gemmatimonadetes bacterium]|nr:DUF3987 domain-containing protein [Gemmatimonadota bacterium]
MIAEPTAEEVVRYGLLAPEEREGLRRYMAALGPADFVSSWRRYGESRTDAPPIFHEVVALLLLSTALDRTRWLDLQHGRVWPNLFVFLLAPSGARKSTPLRMGETVALDAFPQGGCLPTETSPEGLITALHMRTTTDGGARGLVFIDEAGRLLATARRNGYAETVKDLLSRLWDSPESYTRTLRLATYRLEHVYLNLVMATTPSRAGDVLTVEDVASGFLARFLPIVVTDLPERRPLARLTDETAGEQRRLLDTLKAYRQNAKPAPVAIEEAALIRLDRAEVTLLGGADAEYEADLLLPWARRLAEYGPRLALLYAVSEGAETVKVEHVWRGLALVETAKESAQVIVDDMTKGATERKLGKVLRFIQANPGGISGRDLQRRAKLSLVEVSALTADLEARGLIRATHRPANSVLYLARPTVTLSPVSFVSPEVSPPMEEGDVQGVGDRVTGDSGDGSAEVTEGQGDGGDTSAPASASEETDR